MREEEERAACPLEKTNPNNEVAGLARHELELLVLGGDRCHALFDFFQVEVRRANHLRQAVGLPVGRNAVNLLGVSAKPVQRVRFEFGNVSTPPFQLASNLENVQHEKCEDTCAVEFPWRFLVLFFVLAKMKTQRKQ